MIKSINGLAFRFFKTNKYILSVSIFGILLSVSLIITMAVFSANAKQSLENEVSKMYGNMDLSVGYNLDQVKVVDMPLISQISAFQNELQISRVMVTNLRINKLSAVVYTLGVENDSLAKSRYHFSKDIARNELILNQGLAQALNAQVGESIQIEDRMFAVKEVLPDLDATGVAPDLLVLSTSDVKEVMKAKGGRDNQEATYLLIKAKDKANLPWLIDHIRQIDPELRIDVAQENEFLQRNWSALRGFIVVITILILIVTSLIIVSNYEVVLYKSRNQFAIMRSIGATSNQMFRMVLFQCSMINIVGAMFGYLVAFLSYHFLQGGFERLFSYPLGAISFNHGIAIIIMLVCMIAIEAFMLIPAYKSSKILPIRIMQENEKNDFSRDKTSKGTSKGKSKGKPKAKGKGFLLAGAGFFLIVLLMKGSDSRLLFGLIAILLLMVGIMRLFPYYLTVALTSMLPVIRRLFGKIPHIAVKNVLPQVRRNTFIILIISLLMIIAVFGSTFLKTIGRTDEVYVKKQYPTEIIINSRLGLDSGINSSKMTNEIKKISDVVVSTLSNRMGMDIIQGNKFLPLDYRLVDFAEMGRQGLIPPIGDEVINPIILTKKAAKQYKLAVGDKIELALYSVPKQQRIAAGNATVAAIMGELPGIGTAFMDWSNGAFITEYTRFETAFVQSKDTKKTLKQLEKIQARYPELQISTLAESLKKSKQFFYQRWSLFIAVEIVILLSVMFGVFNTLMNSVHSKRKEFAILRTLRVTQRGIVQYILTQVILYIFMGCVSGVTIGMLLSYSIYLIEPVSISIYWRFVGLILTILLGGAILVFVPTGNKIGRMNISSELMLDNK